MEWQYLEKQLQEDGFMQQYQNGVCSSVMTEEQLETLRKQIAAYVIISDQLVEMHKTMCAQKEFAGMKFGVPYCDPIVASAGHKITARQRWNPTARQIEILESMYREGNGTPGKHKIKEITAELTQHGQITETNVYNWFQNRRARSKRKQAASETNHVESKADAEAFSAEEKKTKPQSLQNLENSAERIENMYFEEDPDTGIDHLIDQTEIPGSYNPYNLVEQLGFLQ